MDGFSVSKCETSFLSRSHFFNGPEKIRLPCIMDNMKCFQIPSQCITALRNMILFKLLLGSLSIFTDNPMMTKYAPLHEW